MLSMLKDCKITRVLNSVVAGTSAQTSSVLDMTGFDAVMFIAAVGDVTIASVVTLTVKENTANSTSSPTPTAVTGTAPTFTDPDGTSEDNGLLVSDVIRPSKRFVFAVLTRTVANCVIDGIFAIQYRARSLPVTQSSSVLVSSLQGPEN